MADYVRIRRDGNGAHAERCRYHAADVPLELTEPIERMDPLEWGEMHPHHEEDTPEHTFEVVRQVYMQRRNRRRQGAD